MREQSERFSDIGVVSEFVGEAQLDPAVRQHVLRGLVHLVYISPEKIICNTQYRNMLLTSNYIKCLVALVVDEAHCIKTWLVIYDLYSVFILDQYFRGHDFRKAFADIGELRSIIPSNVNVMALTATATLDTCNKFTL